MHILMTFLLCTGSLTQVWISLLPPLPPQDQDVSKTTAPLASTIPLTSSLLHLFIDRDGRLQTWRALTADKHFRRDCQTDAERAEPLLLKHFHVE